MNFFTKLLLGAGLASAMPEVFPGFRSSFQALVQRVSPVQSEVFLARAQPDVGNLPLSITYKLTHSV